jgi:hypothetical protein
VRCFPGKDKETVPKRLFEPNPVREEASFPAVLNNGITPQLHVSQTGTGLLRCPYSNDRRQKTACAPTYEKIPAEVASAVSPAQGVDVK